MPNPSVYEQEYSFWPWGKLLDRATAWVCDNAPPDSHILDYMCGTGYLLNAISMARTDITASGCDIDPRYIEYGSHCYARVSLHCQDALEFEPPATPTVILCTAGLHHLPRNQQIHFVAKMASELQKGQFFLIGEEVIREFRSEQERRAACLEMASSLIAFAIAQDAPSEVLGAAVDMLSNDLFENGEYKMSEATLLRLLEPQFDVLSVHRTWPANQQAFGAMCFIAADGDDTK